MLKRLLPLVVLFLQSKAFALTNSLMAESPEWSPIVQIKSEAPDSSGESIPGYCNGTFIAKNIILTAAHCIKFAYLSKDNLIALETGYYKYITKADGTSVRLGYVSKDKFKKNVNIEIPKSLSDKFASRGEKVQINPDEDFAILWWNEATPEIDNMSFAETVTASEHAAIIKNIKAYSFSAVSINLFSVQSLDTKRMGALDNFKWNSSYVYSKSIVRVEEGDSGAPLFVKINNKMKMFGVVKGKATTVFDNWDVYPAIHSHLCTLNKKMPTDMKIGSCL